VSFRSVRVTAATALLVAVAYYVGANFGFFLRIPPSTPSVLWPPNTILTATLLLTPPRRWWIYLLAALPAHLAAELGMEWPASLVLALFITNCSEALIAAAGVRWFSDAPGRFDTLRRVTVFIVAAGLVAPFLSSFVDAAAVAAVQDEPYWLVWRVRFFSNVLTELMLGPAIILAVTAGSAWLRSASRGRRLEAALLAVALVIVGAWVFGVLIDRPVNIPGASVVVFLLPLILLMTVRFGPGGASLALLSTSLIAIWASAHGRGPFAVLPPAEGVQALQILLTMLIVPILCLAAVIVELHQATRALGERLEALRASEVLKSAILASLSSSGAAGSSTSTPSGRATAANSPAPRRPGSGWATTISTCGGRPPAERRRTRMRPWRASRPSSAGHGLDSPSTIRRTPGRPSDGSRCPWSRSTAPRAAPSFPAPR